MKEMFLNAPVVYKISDVDLLFVSGLNLELMKKGYLRSATEPYNKKLLHVLIAERMGLDTVNYQIDHHDNDRLNNQRDNLREATNAQNQQNASLNPRNKTGYKGVSFCTTRQRYNGSIRVDGRTINLGYFDTPWEAHEAYCKAADKHFGQFANYG